MVPPFETSKEYGAILSDNMSLTPVNASVLLGKINAYVGGTAVTYKVPVAALVQMQRDVWLWENAAEAGIVTKHAGPKGGFYQMDSSIYPAKPELHNPVVRQLEKIAGITHEQALKNAEKYAPGNAGGIER